MQFTKPFLLLATLCSGISSVLANDNFYGVTVANSIGNSGTYTCRTQAQVSFVLLYAHWARLLKIMVVEPSCQRPEISRLQISAYSWL